MSLDTNVLKPFDDCIGVFPLIDSYSSNKSLFILSSSNLLTLPISVLDGLINLTEGLVEKSSLWSFNVMYDSEFFSDQFSCVIDGSDVCIITFLVS